MKKRLIGGLALAMVAAAALAQPGTYKVHTQPRLPSTEALERMSLTLAWQARVLLRGNRDGFASVQLLTGRDQLQVLVQSYSGLVALFDGETGDQLWQTQVGTPYWLSHPAGFNADSIFVTRRTTLHVLSRHTGLQRIYTTDKVTSVRTYGIDLPYIPSAAPVADEIALYFVMGGRAMAFELPAYGAADKLLKQGEALGDMAALLPEEMWLYLIGDTFVQFAPMAAANQISFTTGNGNVLSLTKYNRPPLLRDDFEADGKIVAPPGQHGIMAYIGTEKATLYAYNMDNSKLAWRFLPGGAIRSKPAATDRDVFVAGDPVGLYRVRRDNGREVWLAKQIDRYLASNDNFVYALHHSGELHVLDYMRGSTLARYDMKDWTIPVLNDLNDRIYLASHDGQIICLRHRDLKVPLRSRTPLPPKMEEKKEEKKKDEPKEEVDKEKEKEKEKKKDKGKGKEKAKEDASLGLELPAPVRPLAFDALPSAPVHVATELRLVGAGRQRLSP